MSPWEPFRGLLGVPIVRFVLLSNLGGHKTGISITLGYYITEKTTLLSLYRVFIKNVAQQLEQLETRGLFLCEDHGS